TLRTPVQNNSSMYAVIYTYTKGPWIIQPYYQYSRVPTNPEIGIVKGASTHGGALLVNHTFKHGFSLSGTLGIHHKHGERPGPSSQLDFRSRQRGHVVHSDAHLPVRTILLSWRPFLGARHRLDARFCLRTHRGEQQPATGRRRNRIHVLRLLFQARQQVETMP